MGHPSSDPQVTSEAKTADESEYDPSLRFFDIGVWRIILEKTPGSSIQTMRGIFRDAPTIFRLLKDFYHLGPGLFMLMVFSKVWQSLEALILLELSSRLLGTIEHGIRTGHPDVNGIFRALAVRLFCVVLAAILKKLSERGEMVLEGRSELYFENWILQHKLRQGVTPGQEERSGVTAKVAWDTLKNLFSVGGHVLEIAGGLSFLFRLSTSNSEGPIFAALCLTKPILTILFTPGLWDTPHVMTHINEDWKRVKNLRSLGTKSYREEVISGDLVGYLLTELRGLMDKLKHTALDYPAQIWEAEQSVIISIIKSFAEDLPMVYYATNAAFYPGRLSVTSIATLQQASAGLRSSFGYIRYLAERFKSSISNTKRLYALEALKPNVKDGELAYPLPEQEKQKGMSFELKDVSFTYPATQTKEPALKNISCTIKAGQLVVIVGANGSGKSTIIKLLNRLFDVTSGSILVDGHDISSYRLSDFRRAAATLTQEHHIFPISVKENIGMGYPKEVGNESLIETAAKESGAWEVIEKFKNGLKTELRPYNWAFGAHVSEADETPLAKELKKLTKTTEVSGGEKQRLIAARTFMRFESRKISFVTVDEPSSAMDPEAEYALFSNLRKRREGKTMIFVTHRFGHLTQHADLILCMKDGAIVESGTHEDLMTNEGEYSKLYNIQARAFQMPTGSS
ncbi:P-loop containing nucleoside triphosphate hydrolase protein [Pluteus cervinus]|uniref:P-loop containing nucleoside triphosphate hydrolase protein n=1 Tax=Pluteus cervinus TaxID=181527 RepID=A0ACD3AB63_9AGAR|nr:P-loop containing nucleoside triphosphate hydrolase protein [Pluteus cervinus]